MTICIDVFKSLRTNCVFISRTQHYDLTKQEKLDYFKEYADSVQDESKHHFSQMLSDVELDCVVFDKNLISQNDARSIIKQTLKNNGFTVL